MTDKLKQALKEAIQIENTLHLNVRGQSLALIKLACEEETINDVDILSTLWEDAGDDFIHREFLGANGHTSDKNVTILKESCRELINMVLEECTTFDEIHKALKPEG